MTWSWEWVVEIVARRNGKEIPVGSGALIAPNRILTAAHVVCPLPEGLHVRLEGHQEGIPASINWLGSDDLDVAVLEANLTHEKLGPVLALLSDREVDAGQTWEAKGYPEVSEKNPRREAYKYGDKTQSWDRSEKFLILKETVDPNSWSGLSGAAIIVGGRVVGVMRSFELDHNNKRLRATPVGAFLNDRAFRKAIGIEKEDEILDERILRMIDDVVALLVELPNLVPHFVKRLKLQPAPGEGAADVARTLVRQRKAADTAGVFNQVDADLAKNKEAKEDRAILCKMLWRILPLAIDWQKLVVTALRDFPDRFTSTRNFIELPLRTETIAEIVLAGVDDRACQYVSPGPGKMPVGAGVVRIPAAARAAVIDVDGSRLAESVVQDLASKLMIDHYKQYGEMRDAVEAMLQYHSQLAPEDELLPYYLLFVDGDGSNDDLYTLARSKLKNELPSLRLVRLTGTDVFHETILAKHIDAILRRP